MSVIRPPGTVVTAGLCFSRYVFFLFISPQDLRAPSGDRRETLPHDQYLRLLDNTSKKNWGSCPLEKWKPKTCKIWRDFTQLTIWSRISPEQHNISKIVKICDQQWFLPSSAKQVRWTSVHYRECSTCEFGPIQIWKASDQLQSLPRWVKHLVNFGPQTKSYRRACWPIQLNFFRKTIFRPWECCCPLKDFTRATATTP